MNQPFGPTRVEQTRKHGPYTLDLARPFYRCDRCAREFEDPTVHGSLAPPLDSFDELVDCAREMGRSLRGEQATCELCSQPGRFVHLDYHAYHARSGRDLVVRWRPKRWFLGRERVDLFWWSLERGFEPARPTDEEKGDVRHDVSVRSIVLAGPGVPLEVLLTATRTVLEAYPADPALLEVVPRLVDGGVHGIALAEEIARVHAERRPGEAEPDAVLGESLLQAVAEGRLEKEKLDQVAKHLGRALELDPANGTALVARANLLRVRGDDESARAAFERVIDLHPDAASPHWNLGAMLVESAPWEALGHFERGEELSPDDVDFPRGRARALMNLGRLDEARSALERARELDPDDEKVRELSEELEDR